MHILPLLLYLPWKDPRLFSPTGRKDRDSWFACKFFFEKKGVLLVCLTKMLLIIFVASPVQAWFYEPLRIPDPYQEQPPAGR
jgi:hypothetical protein